jgi:acylphosphatase
MRVHAGQANESIGERLVSEETAQVQRGFRIRGMVQGVGFRWWTRRIARELDVSGDVRNCPDGSVEVRARAMPSRLEEFAERLAEGPPSALVRFVEVFPTAEPLPDGFDIERWP